MTMYQRHQQELQENCIRLAAAAGKPRGLRWTQAEWPDEWLLIHGPETGMLTLFAAVNLSFEAIEGGDMEDVDAVSMIRAATAVFHHKDGRWGTGGKILFNMSPQQAASVVTAGQTVLAQHPS